MSSTACPACGRIMRAAVDQFGDNVLYCDHDGTRIFVGEREKNPHGSKAAHYDALQESERD